MPNKYSHALVLSYHESQGLVDFDRQRSTKTPFQTPHQSKAKSKSKSTTKNFPQSNTSTPQSSNSSHTVSGPRPASSSRVRLESPSPPPLPPSSHPPAPPSQARTPHPLLHRNSSSVDTQIYAPEYSLPPPVQVEQKYRPSETRDVYVPTRLQSPPRKSGREGRALYRKQSYVPQSYASMSSASTPQEKVFWIEADDQDLEEYKPRSVTQSDRRFSDETEIYAPQPSSWSLPASKHGSVTQEYSNISRRPPTPPLTPQQRQGFSLKIKTYLDSVDPTQTHEISRLADDNLRSPPASSSDTPSASTSEPSSQKPAQPRARPSTAATHSSRPLSISTRTTSLNATTAAPFGSWGSPVSVSFTSPTPSTVGGTNYDDDLDSLPMDLPSDLDFQVLDLANDLDYQVLPWEDPINDPAPSFLSPPQVSRSMSTRASSFDSAAPPPIGLTRAPPPILTSQPSPRYLNSGVISKPSTQRPTRSPLSFFKTSPPKAIPYSATLPGKTPIPVSVSRTAAPSIPALFPNYKGPWHPPKSGDANADPPARRRSLLASANGTERRKSWFKTDTLDRTFGAAGAWAGKN